MAAFTLSALREHNAGGKYDAYIAALEAALQEYSATRVGQLSGEGVAGTLTAAQALADFKAYVKRVERKHANPAYDAGSPDLLALFPKGRAWLTSRPQDEVADAFEAFLNEVDARPAAFPEAVRQEGRTVLANLRAALQRADAAAAAAGTARIDLHDGREDTGRQLFRVYAALLLEHFEDPSRAAAFFDVSKAHTGGKRNKPAKLPR